MEWIKVSDKLPLDPKLVDKYATVDVIVASRLGEVFLDEFKCGNTVTPWHQFGDAVDGFITHWMPMPSPPEAGQR